MKKLALLALVVVAASACTIESASPKPSAANTDTPAPAAPAATDKAGNKPTTPGTTPPPSEKPADGPTRTGLISLTQTTIKAGATTINNYTAIAAFSEVAAVTGTAGKNPCTTTTEGACTVTECTIAASTGTGTGGNPNPTATKAPDAGEITVAGSTTIKLDAAADTGAYKPGSGSVELFAAGADISVKAAGATVPAFDQKVVGPSAIALTSTWPAAGAAFDLDRTKDVALVWTGGTAGDVTAGVSSFSTDHTKTAGISCKFPAKDGKGTIPAAGLAKLIVSTGAIQILASSTTDFTQGDWKIALTALSPGKAGTAITSGAANIH